MTQAQIQTREMRPDSEQEIREALAQATKLYQKYGQLGKLVEQFLSELYSAKADLVCLLNAREAYARRNADAEARLAKTEREAQTRLQTVEMGNRALVDRLSKKELDLDAKICEIEKREAATSAGRHEVEVMRDHYERKLASLSDLGKPKK